jgi:hypothetical protein
MQVVGAMEFWICLGGLIGLVVLALRYGYDSRDGFGSSGFGSSGFGSAGSGSAGSGFGAAGYGSLAERYRSPEEVFASFGYQWHGKPGAPQPTPRLQRPTRAIRHRLAVALNALADWLYPVPDGHIGLNIH